MLRPVEYYFHSPPGRKVLVTVKAGEPRATHRQSHRPYKTRVRMPSKLDPHIATIEGWLAAQPQLTALAIVGRLSEKYPEEFGTRQHFVDSYLHVRCLGVKATYTNVRSASLGADWSISAWRSWKTCSSQISRHHK